MKNHKAHRIRFSLFPKANVAIYKDVIFDVDVVSGYLIIIKGMIMLILLTTRSEKIGDK